MHRHEPLRPSGQSSRPGWPPPAAATTDAAPARPVHRAPLAAGAVVASFFLVGLGVAYAQTSDPPSTTATTRPAVVPPPAGQISPAPALPGRAKPEGRAGRAFGPGHHRGPFGKLFGFGGLGHFGGLHGEYTVRKPDGNGFQTWAVQTGEVTAVSPSSLTVKSEDGFSRTWSVDENTVVGSGRDGIGTVKTGDTVRVVGVAENGQTRAAGVVDSTSLGRIGEHWGVPRRK